MKDQVRQLAKSYVQGLYVEEVDNTTETEICEGKFQLVYLCPEALLTNPTRWDMIQIPAYQGNLEVVSISPNKCNIYVVNMNVYIPEEAFAALVEPKQKANWLYYHFLLHL